MTVFDIFKKHKGLIFIISKNFKTQWPGISYTVNDLINESYVLLGTHKNKKLLDKLCNAGYLTKSLRRHFLRITRKERRELKLFNNIDINDIEINDYKCLTAFHFFSEQTKMFLQTIDEMPIGLLILINKYKRPRIHNLVAKYLGLTNKNLDEIKTDIRNEQPENSYIDSPFYKNDVLMKKINKEKRQDEQTKSQNRSYSYQRIGGNEY